MDRAVVRLLKLVALIGLALLFLLAVGEIHKEIEHDGDHADQRQKRRGRGALLLAVWFLGGIFDNLSQQQ